VAYKIVFLRVRIKRFYNDGKYCRNILNKEKIMKKKRVQVKGCFRKNLLIVLGLLVFFCFAGVVQAADSRFQEVEGSNGSIILDSQSGLEWQRCPYGQSWTGSSCSGTPWRGIWENALQVTAQGGFRVPTIDELKTLEPYDQNVFPGNYWFWSSSTHPFYSFSAWGLLFDRCCVSHSLKDSCFQLRLVRAGQ